jgi:F-type H+-transporting ATPase subunit b
MLTFPPDFSFVIQIVSFLLLWAALKRLAFDPILSVLAEREARTHGNQAEAAKLSESAEAASQRCESSLRQVRQEVLAEAESGRKRAEQEQNQVIASARREAETEIALLRAEIAAQVEGAKASLQAEARSIAALMAQRVTGRDLA